MWSFMHLALATRTVIINDFDIVRLVLPTLLLKPFKYSFVAANNAHFGLEDAVLAFWLRLNRSNLADQIVLSCLFFVILHELSHSYLLVNHVLI
jgi:hypothetical protein